MSDTIIESVLYGKLDREFLIKWINNVSIEGAPEDCILLCCNRNEFVAGFLSYLRNQTKSILKTNSNALPLLQNSSTPEISTSKQKHQRSISDPTYENDRKDSVKSEKKTLESPQHGRSKLGKRVKTKLFTNVSSNSGAYPDGKSKEYTLSSSDDSRLSLGMERMVISSTPVKNGFRSECQNLPSPVTPQSRSRDYERCDTPRLSRHTPKSQDKSLSLADYLVNVSIKSSSKKKRQRNISNEENNEKVELDLSSSTMFPEIGARKANSLRSDCRRIKPTIIDKEKMSSSLNNFNESFQQPSLALEENLVFKSKFEPKESSNSFETERNILKQEKHKLMEKFNTLNTSASPKQISQPISILQRDKPLQQNFIEADVSKIISKKNINLLIEIYDELFKNNLIFSVNTEVYFLITILLSRQLESEYNAIQSIQNDTIDNILKSIHNSTYFSVRSLWNLRTSLEVVLDKNSLKILGENKKVRSFFPELAKFLLNSYGLKCEAELIIDKSTKSRSEGTSNGIVCFNFETDNADNFPTILSFHNFKKQRDMFYDILRCYERSQSSILSKSNLRARIKTLVAYGQTAANHAHLAALFTQMLIDSVQPYEQESKMSKLQRRLTSSAATESHRLPYFTEKESFYNKVLATIKKLSADSLELIKAEGYTIEQRDVVEHIFLRFGTPSETAFYTVSRLFIMCAENESFRLHLRDALSSEIAVMDGTVIGNETSNSADISKEFLQLSKKLGLLSKFLGYLTSMPYLQVSVDTVLKMESLPFPNNCSEDRLVAPKDKVLENNIALRNHSQPSLDLKALLAASYENGRLVITVPWIVHYLSLLDYTALRTKYYKSLLKFLFFIYTHGLKPNVMKKMTVMYMKSILGWLFDQPHFPQEICYEKCEINASVANVAFDSSEIVDEFVLFELCPCLKDVNVLLATSRVSQEKDGSFRHITPVMISLNKEDRIKNKERELQIRLEEEFIKSQPSSTRRVLELVIERVTSATVKDLTAHALMDARKKSRALAVQMVTTNKDKSTLLLAMETMYAEQLEQLRAVAMEQSRVMKARVEQALGALVGAGGPSAGAAGTPGSAGGALVTAAARACRARLTSWLATHWTTTAVLCKDIKLEMNLLLDLGDASLISPGNEAVSTTATTADDFQTFESFTQTIIEFKELVAARLAWAGAAEPGGLLRAGAAACTRAPPRLRALARHLLPRLALDYCIVHLSHEPGQVTEAFLGRLHGVWHACCPERPRRGAEPPEHPPSPAPRTPEPDDNNSEHKGKVTPQPEVDYNESHDLLNCFDRILCPRNVMLLSKTKANPTEVWQALATVLVFMLENDYLSEDSLTEQCLAVYRQDWPQNILENLSTCMKSVSSKWSRASSGKFTLFLDFLADYCGDMDYELVE